MSPTVLVCFLLFDRNHNNSSWGGKGLVGLHVLIAVHQRRKSEQERRQNLEAETAVEHCLLASMLSYTTLDLHSRGGSTHSDPDLPASIINPENVPQTYPGEDLMEVTPS